MVEMSLEVSYFEVDEGIIIYLKILHFFLVEMCLTFIVFVDSNIADWSDNLTATQHFSQSRT